MGGGVWVDRGGKIQGEGEKNARKRYERCERGGNIDRRLLAPGSAGGTTSRKNTEASKQRCKDDDRAKPYST